MQTVIELKHRKSCSCELIDSSPIWKAVSELIKRAGCDAGFVHLCVDGANGVALSLNENCDSQVRTDMQHALEHIIREDVPSAETLRAALVGCSIAVPFEKAHRGFITGTWQGIYLCDFRTGEARNSAVRVIVTVVKSAPLRTFKFDPPSRGSHDVSSHVQRALQVPADAASSGGALYLAFLKHTSVSIGCSTLDGVAARIEPTLNAIVPERWNREFFTHTYEGPDDMPAHVKCSLVGAGIILPTSDASCKPLLCEHRDSGGWGGGPRSCIVSTASAPAVQRVVDVGCVDGVIAVGDKIKEAVRECGAGDGAGLANVLCVCSAGDVSLVQVERTEAGADMLRPLQAALNIAGTTPSAAATVLGISVTLPLPLTSSEVYAVHMDKGPSKPCKLVISVIH